MRSCLKVETDILAKEYREVPPKLSFIDLVMFEAARDPEGFGADLTKMTQATAEARVGANVQNLLQAAGSGSTSFLVGKLGEGLSKREAAATLGVSSATVQRSRTVLYQSQFVPGMRAPTQTVQRKPNVSQQGGNAIQPMEAQAFLDWLWRTHPSKSGDRDQIAWYKGTR